MTSSNLRDAFRSFTTPCGLITTDGPQGPNVMAAEWTFNVSYHPFLILAVVDPGNKTHDMILESKEFGVSLVAEDQAAAMGFAGHYSKADTDKLSSDVFKTVPAKRIRAPLIEGALLNAECRLVAHYPMGDHTGFLGEVLEFSVDPDRRPLVLHHGSHRLGERIVRAPGLVVAVTPSRARTGDEVVVAGELTGPDRGGRAVTISVPDSAGGTLFRGETVSDQEGGFRLRVRIPSTEPPGAYATEAQSGDLRGRARLEIME